METTAKKKFIGVARSHPSDRGTDLNFEVEITAKDLEAANSEMVQIIKKRGLSIDGYSLKEVKAS